MGRNTDPDREVVEIVRVRDGYACVRCGRGGQLTTQHRVARGMGGTREPWVNQPANLISLCGSGTTQCHGWVEHHPAEARAAGLALDRDGQRPENVPVRTWRGWMLLTNTGTTIPMAPPPF
jgi:hypothetical protein